VLVGQVLSVGEKLWIKVRSSMHSSRENSLYFQTWGQAYHDQNTTSFHSFQSFSTRDMQYPMDTSFSFSQFDSQLRSPSGLFGITWPNAVEHPLFYVAVYAGIGLATAFVSLCSVAAQYTGALRASRLLFKFVQRYFTLILLTIPLQATPRISRPRYIPFPRYNSSRWVKFLECACHIY
jgi:hypothetical protein